ncbi:MAG: uracil-DNA glycosylase family protein [Thermoplasmatota archaeon]
MTRVASLVAEWRANGERWEAHAKEARDAGLQVWNPALYAGDVHAAFLARFPPKKGALLALGLNPGPAGMAQTGVPFTDCRTMTRDLGIPLEMPGRAPPDLAARLKKPNGKWRLTYERSSLVVYAGLRACWGDVATAYANWFVGNPCPLLYLDPDGWNVTPADPRLRRLASTNDLRREAVERFAKILDARGVVCLGKDVADAVGDVAARLVGEANVVRYPHPARAVPKLWAADLKRELAARGLL